MSETEPTKTRKKSTRKKAVAPEKPTHYALEDPSIHDFSHPASDSPLMLVYNPNPYPVTASSRGQSLPGYERAVVSSLDRVPRRAIEKGILLVPSDQ